MHEVAGEIIVSHSWLSNRAKIYSDVSLDECDDRVLHFLQKPGAEHEGEGASLAVTAKVDLVDVRVSGKFLEFIENGPQG